MDQYPSGGIFSSCTLAGFIGLGGIGLLDIGLAVTSARFHDFATTGPRGGLPRGSIWVSDVMATIRESRWSFKAVKGAIFISEVHGYLTAQKSFGRLGSSRGHSEACWNRNRIRHHV